MFVFLNLRTSFSNVKYHKESNGTKIEGFGVGFIVRVRVNVSFRVIVRVRNPTLF